MYNKNFIFETEHLLTMTPENADSDFNLQIFGTPDPVKDRCLKFERSSSLCFYKKAIRVNVNEVINKLKKMEVRTQGNYHKQEEYLQQRSLSL